MNYHKQRAERAAKGICLKCDEPAGFNADKTASFYCDTHRPAKAARTNAAAYLGDQVVHRKIELPEFKTREDYLNQSRATMRLLLNGVPLSIADLKRGLRGMGIEPRCDQLMLTLENAAIEDFQCGEMTRYTIRSEFVKEIRFPTNKNGRQGIAIGSRQTHLFRMEDR